MRPRRTWGNQRYANSVRRMRCRPAANRQPLLPTPTGYDFSGSVQRPVVNRPSPPTPASYDFSGSEQRPAENRQPPSGYDFFGSVQQPAPFHETPVNPARYVFSWGGPLRDAGLGSDFTADR